MPSWQINDFLSTKRKQKNYIGGQTCSNSEVGSEEESAAGLDCPIHLTIDPVVPGLRYLCHHRSGVHCVALPMAAQVWPQTHFCSFSFFVKNPSLSGKRFSLQFLLATPTTRLVHCFWVHRDTRTLSLMCITLPGTEPPGEHSQKQQT